MATTVVTLSCGDRVFFELSAKEVAKAIQSLALMKGGREEFALRPENSRVLWVNPSQICMFEELIP